MNNDERDKLVSAIKQWRPQDQSRYQAIGDMCDEFDICATDQEKDEIFLAAMNE
jgi:hypothetical protein